MEAGKEGAYIRQEEGEGGKNLLALDSLVEIERMKGNIRSQRVFGSSKGQKTHASTSL